MAVLPATAEIGGKHGGIAGAEAVVGRRGVDGRLLALEYLYSLEDWNYGGGKADDDIKAASSAGRWRRLLRKVSNELLGRAGIKADYGE